MIVMTVENVNGSKRMIKYINGDATSPAEDYKNKFIIHCCNDENMWGSGFVLPLNRRGV